MRMFVDSFSGAASDLKRKDRTPLNVLRVLSLHPRVSTWDMSENGWLCLIISQLQKAKLIKSVDEPYPWHKYQLAETGKLVLAKPHEQQTLTP